MTALTRHLPAPVTDRDVSLIEAQVRKIATSALVPDALRGKPADILLIGLKARELGVDRLTVALQHIVSIKGTVCLSAQMCVALAKRAGHDLWVEEYGPESVTVAGCLRQRPNRVSKVTWTKSMAATANLLSKDVWKQFPQAMLFARASKDWVKMNCPEVMMGLDDGTWSFEELAGLPDEEAPGTSGDRVLVEDATGDVPDVVDDDPTAAMTEDAWAHQWGSLCRTKGATPADSKSILRNTAGVEYAAQVLPEKRTACENALADWAEAMAAPFDGPQ